MKNFYTFPVIILSIFTFLYCNQSSEVDLKTQGEVALISFEDQGCVVLAKGVTHLIENDDALHAWGYDNGVLSLDFMFTSNCASLFMDEINTTGSVLEIVLTDTADGHARCICDFMESFSLSAQGTNQVHIIFSIKPYPHYELTKLVDRVITF